MGLDTTEIMLSNIMNSLVDNKDTPINLEFRCYVRDNSFDSVSYFLELQPGQRIPRLLKSDLVIKIYISNNILTLKLDFCESKVMLKSLILDGYKVNRVLEMEETNEKG